MEKIIKVATVIGTELRSRSKASAIYTEIGDSNNVVLDLAEVSFMSRSFADELCNIMASGNNVTVVNAHGVVADMLHIVSESRKRKRVRTKDNAEIKDFEDMESLSSFLLAAN